MAVHWVSRGLAWLPQAASQLQQSDTPLAVNREEPVRLLLRSLQVCKKRTRRRRQLWARCWH